MEMKAREITLSTLAGGAVEEEFQRALLEVATSIDNPNTEAKTKRHITIKVEFSPNENRTQADISASVNTKFPPHVPATAAAFIGTDKAGVLQVRQLEQLEIPTPDNVRRIEDGS